MNKLACVCAALLLASIPTICAANNAETWNTLQASKSLGGGVSVGLSEESRIGVDQDENPKRLDEFHTTAFADWRISRWVSVGVQDDMVLLRNESDARYRRDNRPGVNIGLFGSLEGFDFMNRSRFVMRDLEGERPYFRYRNLTKATLPELFQAWERPVRPYVSYEWYFDEGSKDRRIGKSDKFCQFWTDFGLQVQLSDCVSASLFYRLVEVRSASSHDWSPGHVVGVTMCISF